MQATINHAPNPRKIQVYKNDFFNGVIMLTKKLFML